MDNYIMNSPSADVVTPGQISIENRLDIIDEAIRKKYLARLSEMPIASVGDLPDLEDDMISNVRLYRITEMVYQKGEPVTDKFTTVFNTLSTYNASVFILIDSDGKETNFYIGVRNNEPDDSPRKRSTVTLGNTLKQTLIGHFPGVKIENEDRKTIKTLSDKISAVKNVASVSVVGNNKIGKEQTNEQFVQGLEKLALALSGYPYIGLIVAENQSSQNIQMMRKGYQELYTRLSPLQKVQYSENASESNSRSKSFTEMNGKQKAAMIGGAAVSLAGVIGGAAIGVADAAVSGAMIGGQIAGQFSNFINSLAPSEQITKSTSQTVSSTVENKSVTDMMALIDEDSKPAVHRFLDRRRCFAAARQQDCQQRGKKDREPAAPHVCGMHSRKSLLHLSMPELSSEFDHII